MRTSVIIPVYNAERYLSRCLDSLIDQTASDYEIILVNDGSDDESEKICRNYAECHPELITYKEKQNGGVSSARNFGIELASGEAILFCDADDYVENTYVQKMSKMLEECKFAACAYFRERGGAQSIYSAKSEIKTVKEAAFEILCTPDVSGAVWNKGFLKSQIGNLRFRENLSIGEDMLFCMEYMFHAGKPMYLNEPLYHYCWNESSALQKQYSQRRVQPRVNNNLESAEYIWRLVSEESGGQELLPYAAYRQVRSSMWVFFQYALCGDYAPQVMKRVQSNCKKYYKLYKCVNYGSFAQKILINLIRISPRCTCSLLHLACRLMPRLMDRYLV